MKRHCDRAGRKGLVSVTINTENKRGGKNKFHEGSYMISIGEPLPLQIPQVARTIFNLQAAHIIRLKKPNGDYVKDFAPLLIA